MLRKTGRMPKLHTLPIALILWPIVARDYRLRFAGRRPDRWHWADSLLLRLGWYVSW